MTRRKFIIAGLAAVACAPGVDMPEAAAGSELLVPAEDARHELTFMQWPVSRRVYRDAAYLDLVQRTIADIANAVTAFEPVVLLAVAGEHARIRRLVSASVTLWDVPTEDLWCRDSGPLIARTGDGGRAVSRLRFNGWGGRQVHAHDGSVAVRVAERLGFPVVDSGLTGEAGGVEQDGHGLLMAHESSWVAENRNPGMTRAEIERRLLKAYGAERMIWSPGVSGRDITDYHIDGLVRFTGPGRVLMTLPGAPDPADPFHVAARETHDALMAAGLEVDVIPEPETTRVRSADFVAAYANYYVCNGAVIAAQFGDRSTDRAAVDALARHYPDREIVTLNADALGESGGGIHCATQQLPAV